MSEYDNEITESDYEEKNRAVVMPAWFISLSVHMVLIISLLYCLMPSKPSVEDIKVVEISSLQELVDEELIVKTVSLVKADIEVENEVVPEEVPVEFEEPVFEEFEQVETTDVLAIISDPSEYIPSDSAIGVGTLGKVGRPAGLDGYKNRTLTYRCKIGTKNGMPEKTINHTDMALWWLANHQEEDGHWDSGKYEGAGTPEVDTACTGAALLAFLGAGQTDKIGKWKKNVKRAVNWLLLAQRPDGSFDKRNYANGICTMALAEVVGMGVGGSKARKAADLAVDYLLKQQNVKGGYDYTGPSERDDMSVTGWCIMGLKSALVSGIKEKEIKTAFRKVGLLMNAAENNATTGDNTSSSKGYSWYTSGKSSTSSSAVAAIGMMVRQYLGWNRNEPWIEAVADGQISKIPTDFKQMNVYRVYYCFLSLLQHGGKHWKTWNRPVNDLVIKSQRTDGDFKGSWDNNGKGHMAKGGRVLTTAFLALTLEVYYRHLSVEIN